MKRSELEALSVMDLVDRFAEIGVAQDKAILYSDTAKFNRLFKQATGIVDELRRRPGDQRRALVALHKHENLQVRLEAAKVTVAVAPDAARRVFEDIAKSKKYPYAGDAGMSLYAIDQGIYKPT